MKSALLAFFLFSISAFGAEESFQSSRTLPYPADEAGSIGVAVKSEPGALRIVKVLPGGPAEGAKLQTDDLIIQADATSFESLTPEQKIDLIRGKKGTPVTVVITRTVPASKFTIVLTRVPLLQFFKPKSN